MVFVKDALVFLAVLFVLLLGAFVVHTLGTEMLHIVPAQPALFVVSNIFWIGPVCFAAILYGHARRKLSAMTYAERRIQGRRVFSHYVMRFVAVIGSLYLLGYLFVFAWPSGA